MHAVRRLSAPLFRHRGHSLRCLCSQPPDTRLPVESSEPQQQQETPAAASQKGSFLPDERPWEGPKPESEIIRTREESWHTNDAIDPKITDDLQKLEMVPPWTLIQYRYPQFTNEGKQPVPKVPNRWKEDYKKLTASGKSIFELPHWSEIFPDQYDIVIIGGGVIGISIALQLRTIARELISVLVVEKDPTYSRACCTNAPQMITQQFMLPENLQMAHYGADFIRNAKHHLSIMDHPPPDPHFTPTGFLQLSDTTDQADAILDNQEKQTEFGSYVDILNPYQMELRFPFLNTEDVLIGAHGVQDEGFVDPVAYLLALRGKAEFLGVQFMHAEFLDFNLERELPSSSQVDAEGELFNKTRFVIVRLPDGRERQIRTAHPIICAGHESGNITKGLNIGLPQSRGLRMVPLPIEKRKRYVFVFNCPDGPGLNFPFLIDGTGVWCRREGLGGNFVCGKIVPIEEEPSPTNLDIDYTFFEQAIYPVLAKRVKAFEKLQIVGAWAYYEDHNYFDQNPIIGKHPYYFNVVWATGFGRHAMLMGPAVGRAIWELIDSGWTKYKTIDLDRFGWSRILNGKPLRERAVVPRSNLTMIPAPRDVAAEMAGKTN